MSRNLIIGSGPAAAAATLALVSRGTESVTIMDLGARLEEDRQVLLSRVAGQHPREWSSEVESVLARRPTAEVHGELPQKQVFGSDFTFRDLGQLADIFAVPGGNRRAVSGAFGGFSNAWGAQILPFSRETIAQWPVPHAKLLAHYEAILQHIPYAAVRDDYAEVFPLLAQSTALPTLSPGAEAALNRYRRRRNFVRRTGVLMGSARLAFDAKKCIRCGLCLSGCPSDLIYSARQTLDPLIRAGSVSYQPGVLVLAVGEDDDGCWVRARRIADGSTVTQRADRIFIAAGGLGSTRVVANSARRALRQLDFAESAQFVLPFISRRAQPDPRTEATFTLNQFSAAVRYGRAGLDLAHLHFYPYNPAFEDELPEPIARRPWLKTLILKRTVAVLGYLPSWASPTMVVDLASHGDERLPSVRISGRRKPETRRALVNIMARLMAAAPALDLWPALPLLRVSGPGKSYHFGGSFPHVSGAPRAGAPETDTLGRLSEWQRIHLIDGAVLPTVPATTFTLTVMANAHRIATAVGESR